MEQGPHTIHWELGDWTIEKFKDGILYSLKGRIISHVMMTYNETSLDYFTITKQQATLENLKLIMLHDNTTGGPDYVHMLKTMCKDVVFVNNLKSTDLHLTPLTFLLKGLNRRDHLQIVLWTLSRTYHQLTASILFWSW